MKTYTRLGAAASILAVAAGTAIARLRGRHDRRLHYHQQRLPSTFQVGGVSPDRRFGQQQLHGRPQGQLHRGRGRQLDDAGVAGPARRGDQLHRDQHLERPARFRPRGEPIASAAPPQHGGTDNFDVSNLRLYEDTNNNGAYDSRRRRFDHLSGSSRGRRQHPRVRPRRRSARPFDQRRRRRSADRYSGRSDRGRLARRGRHPDRRRQHRRRRHRVRRHQCRQQYGARRHPLRRGRLHHLRRQR